VRLQTGAELNTIDAYLVPIILGSLIVGGILIIALGVFEIFIGRGLWKGQQWARIVTIIITIIGFISALPNFDVISLLITGLIAGYLIFSKDVKAAFRK